MSFEYLSENFIFDHNTSNSVKEKFPTHSDFPSVYILYSKESKKAYIGESTNVSKRLNQHLANPEKNKLDNVKIIFSHYFNKSSVLDIESHLIQNMLGDNQFKLLNSNDGISNHNYFQKSEYEETFRDIWAKLKFEKLVKHDLLDIKNSDLFKYSPYKNLSQDQYDAITNYFHLILESNEDHCSTFIQGSAGTGKTILAVYLIKLLLSNINPDDIDERTEVNDLIELAQKVKQKMTLDGEELKIALVIPMTSLRKTLKKVFKSIYGLSQHMVIGPNEVSKEHYHLLLVDEAHRLKQRKNITGYKEFDKTNRHFNLDKEKGTELDWVLSSSKYQLFFYDDKQSIRPTDVPKARFSELKKSSTTIPLKSQMRIEGGEDYIEFVDKLLNVSDSLVPWKSSNYELKLFTSMQDLIRELQEKEDEHGLCRTISGYSWKWISKDSHEPDVTIDGVKLYWNKTSQDWINSTNDVREMGCIHTTQGYDLNYSGIIFGSDITYNEDEGRLEIIPENYYDRNGKVGINTEQLFDYILNIYRTIMYRGVKGTFVYCHDEKLRKYFKRYLPQS